MTEGIDVTTIVEHGEAVDVTGETRELVGEEIRRLLASRMSGAETPDTAMLEAIALEAIEDLVGAVVARDWSDVGAIELEASRGAWRIEIRVSRDATLVLHEACSRGRRRGWR